MKLAAAMVLALWMFVPAAGEGGTVEIPVTRVVLFSSGVGYFEHNGTVEGDAVCRLMFKAEQINDVLKSMVVMDPDGTVSSINYASQEPLIRALRSFAIDLSGDPKIADLLRQLRGAEVTVEVPEKLTGKILSIETVQKQVTAGSTTTILPETVLNLATPRGIKSVGMGTVQSLTLTDEKLTGELNKALDLLMASHDTRRKAVEINFSGRGSRAVRIGYISETPVWKASYRLEFRKGTEKGKDKEGGFIQGWAIVENSSDMDWTRVSLALVSGRPISFIQDLYTPLYLPRPVVQPELYSSLKPQKYEEGLEAAAEVPKAEMAAPREDRRFRAEALGKAAPAAMAPAPLARERGEPLGAVELAQGVQSVATASKMGELFHFTIAKPVVLPRRQSAMLPILNSTIQAEKVSIYNASVLAKNPLNGASLINDTGIKMPGGPITIFDGGMYAGDARVDNLVPKDKRLISYAIDLDVTVDSSGQETNQVTSLKIVQGVLQIKRLFTWTQKYQIKNKADEERQVIVEHPLHPDRALAQPSKFEEKTPTLYRFRVPVKKDSGEEFLVREERVGSEELAIVSGSTDLLVVYSKNEKMSKKVRDALAEAIRMRQELAASQSKLESLSGQLESIKSGQDRLRKNIGTAGRDSELGRRYLKKLSEEENQIEELNKTIQETQGRIEGQRRALANHLKNLDME